MSKIEVDITEMETALAEMATALGQFKDISAGAFLGEINTLAGMNADFTNVYAKILKCMNGWGASALSQNIESYYQDARAILDSLIVADETESKKIQGIANGGA